MTDIHEMDFELIVDNIDVKSRISIEGQVRLILIELNESSGTDMTRINKVTGMLCLLNDRIKERVKYDLGVVDYDTMLRINKDLYGFE